MLINTNETDVDKYRELISDEVDEYMIANNLAWRDSAGNYHFRMGSCYTRWAYEKKLLKERYGIDWITPDEANPGVMFD